jgi:hypothetical protein
MTEYSVVARPHGKGDWFIFAVLDTVCGGRSRTPLLDACRQLQRMGADPAARVMLFHDVAGKGRLTPAPNWALRTTVGAGSGLTVWDPPKGGGPKFVKYREHPGNA